MTPIRCRLNGLAERRWGLDRKSGKDHSILVVKCL